MVIEELLLWPPRSWPPSPGTPPQGVSAQAFSLQLSAATAPAALAQGLDALLAGPLPGCLALQLDRCDPPSPQAQGLLLEALAPAFRHPRWYAPWGRPLLLLHALAEPQTQAFWLQRLRRSGAQLLELHHARPPASQADGVVLLHPHGEPPLPEQAPPQLLALQSSTYGPLAPHEHRAVWLDPAIAWRPWRAHARANTALHAHHTPGLVVLQLPPGQPLPDLTAPPAPTPRQPLERAVVLHAFHLELVEPILQRLEALLASEGATAPATELFVTAPEGHLPALHQRLAALPLPSHLVPVANHGRDLHPFLQLLPDLIARRPELVLKLHTKRSDHLQPGSLVRVRDGAAWREGLLEGLLEPAAHGTLRRRLAEAGEAPCLLAPEAFLWPVEVSMGPSAPPLAALLAEQGLELSALRGRCFPAGSMFVCNQAALRWLQDLQLGATSFESEGGALDGTLGHALERLMALLVPPIVEGAAGEKGRG